MSTVTQEANLAELMAVGATAGEILERDGWDRARLAAFQQARLRDLLAHAVAHSAFYRQLYRGVDVSAVPLTELPTVDKARLMDDFDDVVTDPRLTRGAVEDHAGQLTGTELLHDEYRVMTTGGTSGQKGWFVWGRDDWRRLLSTILPRGIGWWGMPTPDSGAPSATVYASSPLHMSHRLAASLDTGMSPRLLLPATDPLPSLVERLNQFQPETLMLYPSVGALLAEEQLDGRLKISPSVVISSSEQLTDDMRDRMNAAWSLQVFNTYSTTETGPVGSECPAHAGIHLWEDMAVVEVVDQDNRPVPPGTPGAKVLVTNLVNLTQPVVRYEVSDLLTLSPDPCPCGRPFAVVAAVDGRSDDVLRLPGATAEVAVHPKVFRDALGSQRDVVQYQVVRHPDRIAVTVVAAGGASPEAVTANVADVIRRQLAGLGVSPGLPVDVTAVDTIPRGDPASGKFKLVRNLAEPVGSS